MTKREAAAIADAQAKFADLDDTALLAAIAEHADRVEAADRDRDEAYLHRAFLFLATRAPGRQITMVQAAEAAGVTDPAVSAAINKATARLREQVGAP